MSTTASGVQPSELLESQANDIKQLQRELLQARTELDDFTYSVSHDLRASLRHVSAYAQIIQEDLGERLTPDIAAHLATVQQAAKQMTRQIEGLTELSRLTRLDLQLTRLDLGQLLRDVMTDTTPAQTGQTLHWQVAQDIPALQADAVLIRQVLTHLLSNAVKFTAHRAVAEIQITWQTHASGLCALTIADNGAGFNPQYKDKLFHAFGRLHGAREFEGLGMGLALTRKIVERHGGLVWANGTPDAGCSVSFTLPLTETAS
jgi:light-regulated signal transduction histidine kinase (bacteriophytochrome)